MSEEYDNISSKMAEDALRYIYEKYPNLSCGEYMEFSARLVTDVAHWIGASMGEAPKDVLNALLSMAIQIDIIENGETKNDSS